MKNALADAGLAAAVLTVNSVAMAVSTQPHHRSPDAWAYALSAGMAALVFLWRRRPLGALLGAVALLITYYTAGYPGISPAIALAVPSYGVALAGHPRWAAGVAGALYLTGIVVVFLLRGTAVTTLISGWTPHIVLSAFTILLGLLVRSRRELAEETRERLRQAGEERELESARRVAEERVRIARELHDTVAHSMATIAVQAASALHVLDERPGIVREALGAIRDTSREALRELRATLGVLRDGAGEQREYGGLDRLPALLDAVRAAGVPVTLEVFGRARPLAGAADHSAYRILQESLTNVLRHAGPDVRARVRMSYDPAGVAIEVSDDGRGPPGGAGGEQGGHGLGGMRERAEAVGGTLTAGPRPGGGFVVSARLPVGAP